MSILFEIHRIPIGLHSKSTEFFQFFINNSTAIIIFKILGDQRQLNLFKNRFFSNEREKIAAAEKLADQLENSKNPSSGRPYIMFQKNYDTIYKRLIRLDIYNENLICFLDDLNTNISL